MASCLCGAANATAGKAPPREIVIDWCASTTAAGVCEFKVGEIPRVDADTSVVLHVKHFNFIAFGLEYAVQETVIEAYQALEKLWAQLLGLPFPKLTRAELDDARAAKLAAPSDDFATHLRKWSAKLIKTAEDLEMSIARYRARGPAIPDTTLTEIELDQTGFRQARKELEDARSSTLAKLDSATLEEQEQYKSIRATHVTLVEALDAFDAAATLTRVGQRRPLGAKKGGTHVLATLTPTGASGMRKEIEYFVHSSFPVLFHAGYAFSGLDSSAFAKVRTIAGNDLFSQIEAEDVSAGLTAFLSYELKSWGEGRNGVSLGLGTGIKDPGDTLFAVGSFRFKRRIFVSGGVGSNVVEEGSDPVASEVAEKLGLRELFAAVTTRRQWRGFFAVSFSPF
jgi:hypothetical protein